MYSTSIRVSAYLSYLSLYGLLQVCMYVDSSHLLLYVRPKPVNAWSGTTVNVRSKHTRPDSLSLLRHEMPADERLWKIPVCARLGPCASGLLRSLGLFLSLSPALSFPLSVYLYLSLAKGVREQST